MRITLLQFAEQAGIPKTNLYRWRDEGGDFPKIGSDRKYELADLIKFVVEYYKSQQPDEDDELRAAKIRTETARAVRLELINSQAAGELCVAQEVAETWASACIAIKTKLLSLGNTIAGELDELTDPVEAKSRIDELIYEALEELANGEFLQHNRSLPQAGDSPNEAAVEADG